MQDQDEQNNIFYCVDKHAVPRVVVVPHSGSREPQDGSQGVCHYAENEIYEEVPHSAEN